MIEIIMYENKKEWLMNDSTVCRLLRLGCEMCPWLFNEFMDKCIRDASDITGIVFDHTCIFVWRQRGLIAEKRNNLQHILDRLIMQ